LATTAHKITPVLELNRKMATSGGLSKTARERNTTLL